MPIELPEHDPELVNEHRVAARFLELVSPSPDHPERPVDHDPVDYEPPLRASHTFVTQDDVAGRDDPELRKTMVGSLDENWPALDELNRTRRAGVFVVLSPDDAIVAEFIGEPSRGFHAEPSLTVSHGWSSDMTQKPLTQLVWLLSDSLPPDDRSALCGALLATYGATGVAEGSACLRVPGFHDRRGRPVLVHGQGLRESTLSTARYNARQLLEGFGLAPAATEDAA